VSNLVDGIDIFLKLEGFNVTGSIKLKTAIGLIEDLEKRGIAKKGETTIVESSSEISVSHSAWSAPPRVTDSSA
jgi:cysteine synthase A